MYFNFKGLLIHAILSCLFSTFLTLRCFAAEIYKVESEPDGIPEFTGNPVKAMTSGKNAKVQKVNLSSPVIIESEKIKIKDKNINNIAEIQNEKKQKNNNRVRYSEVKIEVPAANATIWNQTKIAVAVRVLPELAKGDVLRLTVNGETVAQDNRTGSFVLPGTNRGEYVLRPHVINDKGEVILSGKSITIYVHKNSRLFKRNGNS